MVPGRTDQLGTPRPLAGLKPTDALEQAGYLGSPGAGEDQPEIPASGNAVNLDFVPQSRVA